MSHLTNAVHRIKSGRKTLVTIYIAASLCVIFFFLLLPLADTPRVYDGNYLNMGLFSEYSHYQLVKGEFQKDWPNWKGRMAGPIITGAITDLVVGHDLIHKDDPGALAFGLGAWRYQNLKVAFAAYNASWLALLFGLMIAKRANALLEILGIFAGLALNCSIVSGQWFYPWDMPTMFFFTWAIITFDSSKKILPLLAVILVGSMFKQTVLFALILVIGSELWPAHHKAWGILCVVLLHWIFRHMLMAAYSVVLPESAFWGHNANNLIYNLHLTFGFDPARHLSIVHVGFANAGALLMLFLLPIPGRRGLLFKLIGGLFVVAIFAQGVVTEYRDWFEVLPLGWMVISEHYFKDKTLP